MTDEIKTPEGAPNNGAEAKKSDYTPEQTEAYVKGVREEAKALRLRAEAAEAKNKQMEQAAADREAASLAEQGQYKKLYEDTIKGVEPLKQAAAEKDAYQKALEALLEKRIADIPEGMRSLIPDGFTPLQKLEYLEKNAALLAGRKAPNLDPYAGTTQGGGATITLTAEQIALAKASNMTPEQYAKQLAKRGAQ